MKKIIVLISGTGSNLEAIINACNENRINGQVIKVISNNPKAFGLERAKKLNISSTVIDHNTFLSRNDFEVSLQNYIDSLDFDLIVLAGFMRVLGPQITSKYLNKMINLHPSLLPLYPGLNTHEKVLANKDQIHGVSVHFVSSELDAGPMIAQGIINVQSKETLKNITERIHKVEHKILPYIINEICNENIFLDNNCVKFQNINLNNQQFLKINYEI